MFTTVLLSSLLFYNVSGDSLLTDSLKEDVLVQAVKASELTPVTQTNLLRDRVGVLNYGQDISYLLQTSPSIVAQSDAGSPFGYSFIRMRGMDYTRINFNINGIPVNDAETQGFFANNFADIASSAQNIQVQRGIGTTANGTAPYAGAINISTYDLKQPEFGQFNLGYGSFNSRKLGAEYGSGVNKNGLAFYTRLSYVASDGFRQNSATDLRTYLVSGGWFGKKSFIKLNAFGGITRSQLSFYPASLEEINANPRFNPLTAQETDEFQQNFFQLQGAHRFSEKLKMSGSVYYVKGNAPRFALNFPDFPYYFANMPDIVDSTGNPLRTSSDMLVSYRLNQDFIGGMFFINYSSGKVNLIYGLHANSFKADHFMEILAANSFPEGFAPGHLAYFNTGYKTELSNFVKAEYYANEKNILYADIQARATTWRYNNRRMEVYQDTFTVEPMQWFFINPKVGYRKMFNQQHSAYATVGQLRREPTRLDYFSGSDNPTENILQSALKPESVINVEAGYQYKSEKWNVSANVYSMEFSNQIVETGALNAIGYSIRQNTNGSSFRRGLEAEAAFKPNKYFVLAHSAAYSYNRIRSITQLITDTLITFTNVQPVLTPQIWMRNAITVKPLEFLEVELVARYVGEMYLHNSNDSRLKVPDYWVVDARVGVQLPKGKWAINPVLQFHVQNVGNVQYFPAGVGSLSYETNANGERVSNAYAGYFIGAPANYFANLLIRF